MADVTVTQDIAAPPATVWALLSDLSRMPEWSPENERVEWLGGATAAAPGAKFRGTNRSGSKSWKSVSEITDVEAGHMLAFNVKAGPFNVSRWAYVVDEADGGCRVTESWTDRRSGMMKALSKFATGVQDRAAHNRAGMEETLRRLAAAAEHSGTA